MQASQSRCRCDTPILYYDEICPQSRSCLMLIKILDIEVELHPISLIKSEHLSESYRKINPSSTVPTLIDGEFNLSDGHTIMIYLCDKYAGVDLASLWPCDYLPRLNVLNMLFYESGILYRIYNNLLTEILLKNFSNMDMSYHQIQVMDSYNSLDINLKGQSYLAGNCCTIADLSVITTLSGLALMFPISQDQWSNLYKWFGNLKTMDCYKCNEEGVLKLSQLLRAEDQIPLPSPKRLEPSSSMRSSLHLSVSFDKGKSNSCKAKENTELPWNEGISLKKKFFRMFTNKEDITASTSDGQIKKSYPVFLPRIRQNKYCHSNALRADNSAESSLELEKLYKKSVMKELPKSLKESGIEDCRPEGPSDGMGSSGETSSVLKKSTIEWNCIEGIQDKTQSGEC